MNRILLLLSMLLWAYNGYAAAEKVTRNINIGVVFEIDALGHVKSVKALAENNQALSPQLFERFKNHQFAPRIRDGIAVPSTLQSVVVVQAVESSDGQVRMVFKDPKWQAVWLRGQPLNFAVVDKLISNKKLEYRARIQINSDGTVSDVQVSTSSRKDHTETIEMIRNTILTWHYAVDIEAGIPQAMVTETRIGFGYRPNTNILANDWRGPIQIGPMHK